MENNRKRILFLGGTAIQIPAIQMAKAMGLYVITCDNRPDNPGHAFGDEYYDVSITDNEAVLSLARRLDVDAVVNYILEAGIQAAAYTQEQLHKPTSPYTSVHTLSNKQLFRQFLKDNGFAVPRVYSKEELADIVYPVVVKPADLWGSRGFTKVEKAEDLQSAIDYAMSCSLHGEIIIEQFIEPWHAPVEGDGFSVNGTLTTHLWGDCYSDPEAPNPVTPVLYCFPSEKPTSVMQQLDAELQRLLSLLHMQTNAYNLEARISAQGDIYLMEVAPRNGGNAISEITSFATGCNIISGTLCAALGNDCSDLVDAPCQGYWCSYIVHSNVPGTYHGMWYDADFERNNLVSFAPFVNVGDPVQPYTGTNCTVGILVAHFPDRNAQHRFMRNPERYFGLRPWA